MEGIKFFAGGAFLGVLVRVLGCLPLMGKGEAVLSFYILLRMLRYGQGHFQVGLLTVAKESGVALNTLRVGRGAMLRRGFLVLTRGGGCGRGSVYGLNFALLVGLKNVRGVGVRRVRRAGVRGFLVGWVRRHFQGRVEFEDVLRQVRLDRVPSVLRMANYVRAINWLNGQGGQKIQDPASFFYSLMLRNAPVPPGYLAAQALKKRVELGRLKVERNEERRARFAEGCACAAAENLGGVEKQALLEYRQWWLNYFKRRGKNQKPQATEIIQKIQQLKTKHKLSELPDLSLI